MERVIDLERLEKIIDSKQTHSHEEGECIYCEMARELKESKLLFPVYLNLYTNLILNPDSGIEDALSVGFMLAWDYLKSEKLDELLCPK